MAIDNTINGRMPQTIKKRVGCWNAFRQRKCPAAKDITFKEPGACENCALRVPSYTVEQAMVDILEYAEQLERECDELLQKNQQLECERNAVVKALCETHDIFDNHGWTGTPNCMSEARKTINRGLMTFICGGEEVE